MKTKKIEFFVIIVLLLNFITNYVYSNKIYVNNKVGISFIIPKGLELVKKKVRTNVKYEIIYIEKRKFFYEVSYAPIAYDDTISNMKEYIERVINEDEYLALERYDNGSLKTYNFRKDIIGQSVFDFGSDFDPVNYYIIFSRILKDDIIIKISILYHDEDYKIAKRYSEYFEKRDSYYTFKNYDYAPKEFYKLIAKRDRRAPKELLKLQDYFDEIIRSLKFFEPTEKINTLYISKIDGLALRSNPLVKSNAIRYLKKGEKVEVLEWYNEDVINGIKGNWVGVKTEQGEIGWCFDAYLEEVK